VEDNSINMTLGASLLENLGHQVATAVNGRECLAALERETYDLVLMDIQMPLMDGVAALREIRRREQGRRRQLPVIALTAESHPEVCARYRSEGFSGFLSKPLDIQELVEEMERVTRNHTSGDPDDAEPRLE